MTLTTTTYIDLNSSSSTTTFVDTTPPEITIISPEATTYQTSSVPLIFTVNEPTSWIGYSLDEQVNVTITGNITLTDLAEGSHSIIVYANDTSGNMGTSEKIYFTVVFQPQPTVDIHPQTLNLWSRGKWITAYIELPEGYNVGDIDISTVLLNDTIPAETYPVGIGDENGDGIPDLMVKFDRAEVISYILANVDMTELIEERFMTVTLTVTGKLYDETLFQGSSTIRIIYPSYPRTPWRIAIIKMLRFETYMQRFWR